MTNPKPDHDTIIANIRAWKLREQARLAWEALSPGQRKRRNRAKRKAEAERLAAEKAALENTGQVIPDDIWALAEAQADEQRRQERNQQNESRRSKKGNPLAEPWGPQEWPSGDGDA